MCLIVASDAYIYVQFYMEIEIYTGIHVAQLMWLNVIHLPKEMLHQIDVLQKKQL
jgi:hypothetical protein